MLIGRLRPDGTLDVSVEPKVDGWRAQVVVSGGQVSVRTRSGRLVTEAVPHLARLGECDVDVIFDGELVAGAGLPDDFYEVAGMMALRSKSPSFVAFDVLRVGGVNAMPAPYRERRQVLCELADAMNVTVVPSFDGADLDMVFAECERLGIEGIVAKRNDSPYRPGIRSNDWRKAKIAAWRDRHARRRRPR